MISTIAVISGFVVGFFAGRHYQREVDTETLKEFQRYGQMFDEACTREQQLRTELADMYNNTSCWGPTVGPVTEREDT